MAQAGPHARLESAAASVTLDTGGRASMVAATSPAGPGRPGQGVAELLPAPMTTTSNASIATTEVLVSPKGEMIAVAPLTNEKSSLLSACAKPCSSNPPSPPSV
eukprot:scaffold42984_cov63-Phaeocystis_antarctica.AAC.4